MSEKNAAAESSDGSGLSTKAYKKSLRKLQIELVKLQRHFIKCNDKWKSSPIDDQALHYWKAYSAARNEMLLRSHAMVAPWTLVRANAKRVARLNVIKDLLGRLHYADKDEKLVQPDRRIVFAYDPSCVENGPLAE